MSNYPNLLALLDQVEAAVNHRDEAGAALDVEYTPARDDAFAEAEAKVLDVADVALPVLVTVIRGFLDLPRPRLRAFLDRIERELAAMEGGDQ